MPRRARKRVIIGALASAALVGVGCGGDEEQAGNSVTPELTPPQASTDDTTSTTPPRIKTVDEGTDPTQDQDPSTETEITEETTTEESPPPTKPPRVPDNPRNDTPPPRGSPAERFEQFCASNPKACGG